MAWTDESTLVWHALAPNNVARTDWSSDFNIAFTRVRQQWQMASTDCHAVTSTTWIGKWSLWLSCFRINAWHKIRARSDLRHDVRHIIYVYMENLQQTSLCGACSSLPQIVYPPHDISGMHRNENVRPKLNPPSLSQPYTPPPVAHQMVVENCGEQSRANAHINGITCSWKLAYYGNTMKGRGQ